MSEPVYLVFVYHNVAYAEGCVMELGVIEDPDTQRASMVCEIMANGSIKACMTAENGLSMWHASKRDLMFGPHSREYHKVRAFFALLEMGETPSVDMLPTKPRRLYEQTVRRGGRW